MVLFSHWTAILLSVLSFHLTVQAECRPAPTCMNACLELGSRIPQETDVHVGNLLWMQEGSSERVTT